MRSTQAAALDTGSRRLDLLAAVSFASLMFSGNVAYWTSPVSGYYLQGENVEALVSCFVAIAAFAALTYGALRWARGNERRQRPLLWLALPATLFAINRFRVTTGLSAPTGLGARLTIGAVLFALVWVTAINPIQTGRLLHAGFRWSVALAFTILGTLVVGLVKRPTAVAALASGGPVHKPVIVWAIFDELDEGWLFDHRPPSLKLPAFDRLAAESLVCNRVQRPGPETLYSLPALTIGRPMAEVTVASSRDLKLRYEDGTRTLWSKADTVFDDMARLGRVSSIDGWYHNYPQVFEGKVRRITTGTYFPRGLWPDLEYQFWLLLPAPVQVFGLERLGRASMWNVADARQHRGRLEEQVSAFERTIRNRSADFVFFHCRVPHAPWVTDSGGLGSSVASDSKGYFGNMRLADKVLARLVRALRDTGVWGESTLMVTSDHNLRQSLEGVPVNHLVPLILKLPGQAQGFRLERAVRAVDERGLIRAIAAGEVKTPEQAEAFLRSAR